MKKLRRFPKNKFVIIAYVLHMSLASVAFCATYNVAPNFDSDCSDGNCNFQAALDVSLLNNGSTNTIRLAQGEYIGNFTYFPLGNNTGDIEILGGWTADFSSRTINPENTILNGNNTGQVLNIKFEDLDNPVIIGGDIKIEGLTIKNGNAYIAGGLMAFTAAPYRIDILHCIFEANHAEDAAGGCAVGVYDFASTDTDGVLYMENNIISNNDVSMTGATDGNGGGCDIFVNGLVVMRNNLIHSNNVGINGYQHPDGGGLDVLILAGDFYFVNNTVTENKVVADTGSNASGGGISIETKPPGYGGLESWAPGHAYLYNNIIFNNTVSTTQSLGDDIANKVRDTSSLSGSSLLISNSSYDDLWNESNAVVPTLTSNTNSDPLFSSIASSQFHLTVPSPCIDTGLNSALYLPERDLESNIRTWDGNGDNIATVDMGCYEFDSQQNIKTGFLWNLFLPAIITGKN